MISEEAIPDFNSKDNISDTDSKVTPTLENDSVADENNVEQNSTETVYIKSVFNRTPTQETTVKPQEYSASQESGANDNTSTNLVNDSISHQTNEEDNTSTNLGDDSVSHQTNAEDNTSTNLVNDSVSYQQKPEEKSAVENGNSQPVEQKTENEINLETTLLETTANPKIQVEIKSEKERLVLILPTVSQVSISEYSWSEIWQQMKLRLLAQQRFLTSKISVHLLVHDRLLDSRQLQDIADTLSEMSLQLKSVGTSRRQTAIAAAGAGYSVEQLQPKTTFKFESTDSTLPPAEPLYLEMTVRSGIEIRHRGSVIILGDVNPGGIVVADGDILIWGRLRGVAHAGAQGNTECTIMALQMEPTQLRIADALARAPEKSPTQQIAEVAYITTQGIRITKANDFSRTQLTRLNQEP